MGPGARGAQPIVQMPELRVGILSGQEEVRFRVRGNARVDGGSLPSLPRGEYAAQLVMATGAVTAPFWLRGTFATRRGAERCQARLDHADTIQVGRDYSYDGGSFTSTEYWVVSDDGQGQPHGSRVLRPAAMRAELVGEGGRIDFFERLAVDPGAEGGVVVGGVVTGESFHWEHREERSFRGRLELVAGRDGRLCLINVVGLEEYLLSVATSEMHSRCPTALLEAQTVAARSWVLAALGKVHLADPFDLCGEDHCQCYRGIERESSAGVNAVTGTWGQVLIFAERICNARYGKVCGGLRESYRSVWGGAGPPYLAWAADAAAGALAGWDRGVRSESDAAKWVACRPPCYCNPDLTPRVPCVDEFSGCFRWKVQYDGEELERLVNDRLNGIVGRVRELRPLRRGRSGRIELLEIRGSKRAVKVGRELEIRRVLSSTHLPSSAFVCHQSWGSDGFLEKVVLEGAGWGHGVGMCQVGAAAMAYHGHDYRSILGHYYPGTRLVTLHPSSAAQWPQEAVESESAPCWVHMNCYELRRCPVYLEPSSVPCWERHGSPRLGKGLIGPEAKEQHCRRCPYHARERQRG